EDSNQKLFPHIVRRLAQKHRAVQPHLRHPARGLYPLHNIGSPVHLWLGAGVDGFALEISARHRSNRALRTTVLIAALEMPGLAATYASTRRTRRLSIEAPRHRFKAARTGYGGSSSGCATADIYWEMPNTKPRLQTSDAFA